jgi:RNA polymerase sigma-70 factor, ECF subfamily
VLAGMNLETLFREHQRMVFAYFLRMAPSRDEAEELTQETFARACSAALRYRGDARPSTWLLGIARHVLLEAARRGLFDRAPSAQDTGHVSSMHEDPDLRMDLDRLLRALPPIEREAVVLVDVLGFTPMPAAAIAGISREAFRARLHRARMRLREAYADE